MFRAMIRSGDPIAPVQNRVIQTGTFQTSRQINPALTALSFG
jgi:hypothetical protein